MSALYVDDRYRGDHGIGRYTHEVLRRLKLDWQPLGLDGSPHGPVDSFRRLPSLPRNALVYSPGYGALLRAPRQVLTVHDLIHLRVPWPGRAKFAAYYSGPVRRAVRKAGVVLTVSETSARDIADWVRDDSVNVVNAGNGCSAVFHPAGPKAASDEPYVLFIGNTRPHKNLDVVLRALARAPRVRLTAVVPAEEVAAVRARASLLGTSDRTAVLHSVDDERLATLYRGAAATVMPSTLEGFGLPALESIACAVPVIFWRGCQAVAEIVGDRGWALETSGDIDEWAAAILVAAGARRRIDPPAAGAYDWDRTADTVSDVLARTCG